MNVNMGMRERLHGIRMFGEGPRAADDHEFVRIAIIIFFQSDFFC